MSERDLAALAAVPNATLFKYLTPGTRFVFDLAHAHNTAFVLIKTRNGYRHEVGGKQWKTGARTACYPILKITKRTDGCASDPEI